jgi:regulator of cell morphogenesis and NO signaling
MLAATHAGYRAVFEWFGLDYYCSGNLTLDDAALGAGVDPCVVREAMARVENDDPGPNWARGPMGQLLTHLAEQDHDLLRNRLFAIARRLEDARRRHGEEFVGPLLRRFREFTDAVLLHIEREEVGLFPCVAESWAKGAAPATDGRRVRAAVTELATDHGEIIRRLAEVNIARRGIETTSSDPECHAIMRGIADIEIDLHEHLNLENEIMFPRAVALVDQAVVNAAL